MEDLAVQEGERTYQEAERLNADSSFDIPLESHKRCLETISRCCTKKQFQQVRRRFCRVFTRTAVIATTAILVVTTAFAVLPSLRAGALNLLIETFEDRTELRLLSDPPAEPSCRDMPDFTVNWISEGYVLESHERNHFSAQSTYCTADHQEISIVFMKGEHTTVSLDTEDSEVRETTIHGKRAIIVAKGGGSQLCLVDEAQGNYLLISGNAGQEDDLIKIARQIQIP